MATKDVLIVNDSKFESIILKDILIKTGMNVMISNEYMIIQDLKKVKPSMVIVNYIMEEITGDKMIENIKKIFPQTICILSSSNNLSKSQFRGSLIDDIIHTPIQPNQIKEIIGSYMFLKEEKCSNCKKEIQKNFLICPYCGNPLKERA